MKGKRHTLNLAYIATGAVLITVCSWLSIPTAVPFTMQTFAVFAVLCMLGGIRGTASIVVYILLGAIGLPVFAGFQNGAGVIMGLTGGYILGFVFIGLIYTLFEKLVGAKFPITITALSIGLVACYAFGTVWFMRMYAKDIGDIGLGAALVTCVLPFIIPDVAKMALALVISSRVRKYIVAPIDKKERKVKELNIKVVFVDVDNTLLDFDAYVKSTMKEGFKEFALKPYKDYMFDVFTKENDRLWHMIEDKTLTLEELRKMRWNLIFKLLDVDADGEMFETYFRDKLNDSAIVIDGAIDFLKYLHEKYIVCVASNGPYEQQSKRINLAGMSDYIDYTFISEDIGANKPDKEFFDECMKRLNDGRDIRINPDECMMIGDSLSSDVAGGTAAQMKTCLFERKKSNKNKGVDIKPDYTIKTLKGISDII